MESGEPKAESRQPKAESGKLKGGWIRKNSAERGVKVDQSEFLRIQLVRLRRRLIWWVKVPSGVSLPPCNRKW